MNHFYFGKVSMLRLQGVNKDLVTIMENAIHISKVDFGIACGVRTAEEQNKLFKAGLSDCDGYKVKSKHQSGNAVDIYIWDDKNKIGIFEYTKDNAWMWLEVGRAILRASRLLGINIIWGLSFDIGKGYDIDHFEKD